MSQIKLLLDIISDVRSLGDSLQAYADALTTSDKIGDLNDYEEIYTPPEMQPEPVQAEPPITCLLYTSPSPRDRSLSRMPSSA